MRPLKCLLVLSSLVLVGCGLGNISISITPKTATVNANEQFQFSASVENGGNKTVLWSSTYGTVTDAGLFTAPDLAGTCSVIATSQSDPSKVAAALVTVVSPVAVTPSQIIVAPGASQTFTAVVEATGDTNVTWSIREGAAGGSIDAAGVYTAPAGVGIFRVVATSVADPTQYGVAIVKVDLPG